MKCVYPAVLAAFALVASHAVAAPEPDVVLAIAPREQAKESPPEGWCGETAIQEGLLHLGMWAPQAAINRAGKPTHPDLYSPDLPVALAALGVRFTAYGGPRGFEPFARWVRSALQASAPVIAGVKLLPTAHPEWGLDHFVLALGHGARGILVDTTWGHAQWIAPGAQRGISLDTAAYGLRLDGLRLPPDATPARLVVLEDGSSAVKLKVTCVLPDGASPLRVERVTPGVDAESYEGREVLATVPATRTTRFHCSPRPR